MEKAVAESDKKKYSDAIYEYERCKAICNKCVFYCLDYYYSLKEEFSSLDNSNGFDYSRFYSDLEFQNKLIESFRDLFLTGTMTIIQELTSNAVGLDDWFRSKNSTPQFNDTVDKKMKIDFKLEGAYADFVEQKKRMI